MDDRNKAAEREKEILKKLRVRQKLVVVGGKSKSRLYDSLHA